MSVYYGWIIMSSSVQPTSSLIYIHCFIFIAIFIHICMYVYIVAQYKMHTVLSRKPQSR